MHVLLTLPPRQGFSALPLVTFGARGVLVEGLSCALASTHQMPTAPSPGHDNQKCLWTLPHVPWGPNRPWLKNHCSRLTNHLVWETEGFPEDEGPSVLKPANSWANWDDLVTHPPSQLTPVPPFANKLYFLLYPQGWEE